jgi:SAM-dependent methyltransferase
MNRLEKALYLVDKSGLGLEIGPSHNPVAPKRAGFNVEIVDHGTAEELRKKYKDHPVVLENIEAVDYVWKGEALTELTGKKNHYDFIIASHVLEHIPDIVSFFVQCETLLKSAGVLSLIIPDKRYCFDYFRWPSSTGEVLDAYTEKRSRHTAGVVFDHFASATKMDGHIAWSAGTPKGSFEPIHSFQQARNLWRNALTNADYIDVHAWRFTPNSFRLILHDLRILGLIRLVELASFDTDGCEFYVSLGVDQQPSTEFSREELLGNIMNEMQSDSEK